MWWLKRESAAKISKIIKMNQIRLIKHNHRKLKEFQFSLHKSKRLKMYKLMRLILTSQKEPRSNEKKFKVQPKESRIKPRIKWIKFFDSCQINWTLYKKRIKADMKMLYYKASLLIIWIIFNKDLYYNINLKKVIRLAKNFSNNCQY